MSERSRYLTVIVSDPTKEEASALIGHPKMSAASWSHAINDRDAKDAEIAESVSRRRGRMVDDFNNDNEHLIACIEALLELDKAKALVPHGIGGHARVLLSAAGVRLAAKDAEMQDLRKEIAELRAKYEAVVDKYDTAVEKSIALMQERDEALEKVASCEASARRLYRALSFLHASWICMDGWDQESSTESMKANEALAATPEHLR